MKRLLKLGAKPRGNQLDAAAWQNEPGMVKLLLKAGADPNGEKNDPPLTSAAYRGSKRSIYILLKHPDIDVNKRDIDGQTALLVAAKRGYGDIVEILLEAGADPTIKDRHGNTPADRARAFYENAKDTWELLEAQKR